MSNQCSRGAGKNLCYWSCGGVAKQIDRGQGPVDNYCQDKDQLKIETRLISIVSKPIVFVFVLLS